MLWNRMELKYKSKENFRKNYASCVLVSFVFALLTTGWEGYRLHTRFPDGFFWDWLFFWLAIAGFLLNIFVINALETGRCRFYVENRDYAAPASKLLFGFSCGCYGNVIKIMFFRTLKIYLWSLLLIIPGIVKSYEYRMIPYILAEQPDIDSGEAFAISREMMMGQKIDAFVLDLSFLGWGIASAFTCGLLGIFWTGPYRDGTNAELYAVLRDDWLFRHGRDDRETGESL